MISWIQNVNNTAIGLATEPTSRKRTFACEHDFLSHRVDTFVKGSIQQLAAAAKQRELQRNNEHHNGDGDSINVITEVYTEPLLATGIQQLDDVDFVFIARKPKAKPFIFRLGVKLAGASGDTLYLRAEEYRQAYLNALVSEYGIAYKRFESDSSVYYAINLSFAHLGLMTQLLTYHWRLAPKKSRNKSKPKEQLPLLTEVDEKEDEEEHIMRQNSNEIITIPCSHDSLPPSFKMFYFMKKLRFHNHPDDDHQISDFSSFDFRYSDYYACVNRRSFSSQLRFDLTYQLLVGARLKLQLVGDGHELNPWWNLLSCNKPTSNSNSPAEINDEHNKRRKQKRFYANLIEVMEHGIFDDWLCLHEPLAEQADEEATDGRQRCCCCRCPEISDALCLGICSKLCNIWKGFWHTNKVDCLDLDQRPTENFRQYLARVSAVRNVFRPRHFFTSAVDGEGVLNTDEEQKPSGGKETPSENPSSRRTFVKFHHLIPLEAVRRYFGEKIGFYFCWVELFVMSLTIPAVAGVLMFIAGLIYYSVQVNWALRHEHQIGGVNAPKTERETPGYVLAKACDNYATIGFAAVMIIWGTAFTEIWKRRSCWYKHLWRVGHLEDAELRRVNIYSLHCVRFMHRYSRWTHRLMYLPSLIVTLFLVCMVGASIYLINMLDVRLSVKYCNFSPPTDSATMTTPSTKDFLPSDVYEMVNRPTSYFLCNILCVVLHSLSIAIFDAIFTKICYPLTHLEGHETQSRYNASLILKMFTFRFVNNYSILFYIAFVVAPDWGNSVVVYSEALSGINATNAHQVAQARHKSCKQLPCMTLLTKQLLGIIVTAPLVRSVTDRIIPVILSLFNFMSYYSSNGNEYSSSSEMPQQNSDIVNLEMQQKETQRKKREKKLVSELLTQDQQLQELSTLNGPEFTIEEFTEKAIVFGALQMFSVALPPAPALSMVILRFDLNSDIGRIVDQFRRPIPLRSSGIGVWSEIFHFLNYCGVVTSPLIAVLTSSLSSELSAYQKFWIFLLFEHVVFSIRGLVAAFVPDEPSQLRYLRLREKISRSMMKD